MRGTEVDGPRPVGAADPQPETSPEAIRHTFVVGRLTRLSAEIHLVEAGRGPGPFRVKAVVRGPRPSSPGTVH